MEFAQALDRGAATPEAAGINPALDRDMGLGLELQVPLLGVTAIVVPERPLDIDRVGVVPLNQIAVVAIHRADKIRQGGQHTLRQAAPEPSGLRSQLNGYIGQGPPVTGTRANEQAAPLSRAFHPRSETAVMSACMSTSFVSIS